MPSKGQSRSKGGEEAKVPLQAVVLADSFTHRFRPITLERPKTLLPLANVPMIEYTLEFLASNGVEEVFIFCCAHADQLTQYIENSAWSSTASFVVHTIVSTNCISAGEALRLIDHKHVIRSDFILISGDTRSVKEVLKALGGSWNKSLAGWIFPGSRRGLVVDVLRKDPTNTVHEAEAAAAPPAPAAAVPSVPASDAKPTVEQDVERDDDDEEDHAPLRKRLKKTT